MISRILSALGLPRGPRELPGVRSILLHNRKSAVPYPNLSSNSRIASCYVGPPGFRPGNLEYSSPENPVYFVSFPAPPYALRPEVSCARFLWRETERFS